MTKPALWRLDLRYNLYKDHNEGYPLTFSQRKLVIEKYDDESFQRSGVETVKADFTKPTRGAHNCTR